MAKTRQHPPGDFSSAGMVAYTEQARADRIAREQAQKKQSGRGYITKSKAGHYTAKAVDAAGKLIAIQDKLPTLDAARAFNRDALGGAA